MGCVLGFYDGGTLSRLCAIRGPLSCKKPLILSYEDFRQTCLSEIATRSAAFSLLDVGEICFS